MAILRRQWIAFVGKISLEKGVHCLIAAAPEILARQPGAHFLLVGDGVARPHLSAMRHALARGDLEAALEAIRRASATSPESYARWIIEFWQTLDLSAYRQRAIEADLLHRVQFVGFQPAPQVARIMRRADALLVPSLIKEAFPLVSVEALASGSIFVAPHFGGLASLLNRMATELWPYGELARIDHRPERLIAEMIDRADALLRLTQDDRRREEIARLCRRFAAQHFDWSNVASQIESIYTAVIHNRGD